MYICAFRRPIIFRAAVRTYDCYDFILVLINFVCIFSDTQIFLPFANQFAQIEDKFLIAVSTSHFSLVSAAILCQSAIPLQIFKRVFSILDACEDSKGIDLFSGLQYFSILYENVHRCPWFSYK